MPLSHFHRHIIDISLTSITIHHWHCHIFFGISLTSISNKQVGHNAVRQTFCQQCASLPYPPWKNQKKNYKKIQSLQNRPTQQNNKDKRCVWRPAPDEVLQRDQSRQFWDKQMSAFTSVRPGKNNISKLPAKTWQNFPQIMFLRCRNQFDCSSKYQTFFLQNLDVSNTFGPNS